MDNVVTASTDLIPGGAAANPPDGI